MKRRRATKLDAQGRSAFDVLLAYAKSELIVVRFVRSIGAIGVAAYIIDDNEIRIDIQLRECSNDELSYIFAHELGHYIDLKNRSQSEIDALNVAAIVYDLCVEKDVEVPDEIAKTILREEERAFDFGEKLLSDLGIKLRKNDTKKWRSQSLREYKKSFVSGKTKWDSFYR